MVVAVVVPLVAILVLVLPQFRLDQQVVPADGAPHALTVPRGADYAVLVETRSAASAPSCVVADGSGERRLRPVSGSVTIGNRMVVRRFETGDGDLVATCAGGADIDEVALGKYPNMGLMLGGIFGSFGFAMVVGGAGLATLLVTVVRRAKRL